MNRRSREKFVTDNKKDYYEYARNFSKSIMIRSYIIFFIVLFLAGYFQQTKSKWLYLLLLVPFFTARIKNKHYQVFKDFAGLLLNRKLTLKRLFLFLLSFGISLTVYQYLASIPKITSIALAFIHMLNMSVVMYYLGINVIVFKEDDEISSVLDEFNSTLLSE